MLAVAGLDGDAVVGTGLVVGRRPAQHAAGRVVTRAGRQLPQHHGDRVAIGIGRQDRQRQRCAFGQRDRLDRVDLGQVVGAGHGQRQALDGQAAAAVDHPHQHLGVGTVGGLRRPAQRGAVGVAGGTTLDQRGLLQHQAGRGLQQLPEEQRAIGVQRLQRGRPGLAGGGRRQRQGLVGAGTHHGQLRRCVVEGHGIQPVAQVGLDDGPVGAAGAKAVGRDHADGLGRQRGAGAQHAAGGCQRGVQVDQPQVLLVAATLHGAVDAVGEVAARVQQQQHRATQVVAADAGDAHVVAQRTGQAVGAGVGECEPEHLAQVSHGGEGHAVGLGQAHLGRAAHRVRHLQAPTAGRQVGQREDGRLCAGIPAHRQRLQTAHTVAAAADQAVVRRVQHAGRILGVSGRRTALRTRPHGLVEADCQLCQRQRHQRTVADAGGQHLGCLDGRDLVDAGGLRHQDAAIGRGEQAFAARATGGQLQRAAALQLDHPHHAAMRHGGRRTAAHRALRQVGAGKQQPGQRRARRAEGNAVDQAGEAVFHLGAALGAAAHREADDLGRRIGRGTGDVAAGPAHAPQPAIRAEGEITHAGAGELAPQVASGAAIGHRRVEDRHTVAGGHVDQATGGIDGQCMRQRIVARAAPAVDHRTAAGVHAQQLGAGHHPQLADGVERHVEHGRIQGEQRRGRAPALGGEAVDLVARRAGAGQHRAVHQLHQRQRTDVAGAAGKPAAEGTHLHRRQHAAQIGRLGRGHEARQLQRGLGEEIAGDIAAIGRGRGQLCRALQRVEHTQGLLRRVAAAVVGQHGVADQRGLAVAGGIGGHGQELVPVAGLAGKHFRAGRPRHLLAPDAEITAVVGHVHGDMLDATGVVRGLPGHAEGGRATGVVATRGDRDRGARRTGVQRVADGVAVDRRGVVEEHPRRGADGGTGGRIGRGGDGVGDEAGAGTAAAVRQQQAARRVAQHLAGVGIDGLDQPGGHALLRVDAGRHPQHKALAAAEVEVTLEHGPALGQVHVDVADLQVAQPQRAGVQVGVELGHQPQLAHRLLAGVGEAQRVGQRVVGRHVAQAVGRRQRLRAAHRDQRLRRGFACRRLLQVLRQIECLRAHRVELGIEHAQVAQVFQLGTAAGKHVEADEVRFLRGAQVVVGKIGRHRHRDLGVVAFVVLAYLVVIDRRGGRQRISGVTRGVAVPLLHLGEEAQQVGLGAVAVATTADQDAGGQCGVQAQHQFVGPDRRRFALGAQQAGGFQRGQPALHPLRLVGGQHAQRGRRAGIGQDGGAQRDGMRRLVGHELGARQRRGRTQRVEAERHRQRLELGDVLVGLTREELGGQAVADLVEVLHTAIEQAAVLPVRADGVELGAQALEVVGQPFGQAGVGLHAEVEADETAGRHVEGIARGQVPALGVGHAVEGSPGDVAAQRGGGRGAVGLRVAQPFGHGPLRLTADVAAKHHVGQLQALEHVGALAHVRGTDVEAHIGRVDVAQALQRDAVERRVARGDAARAADTDGDVGLDHALDQVAVGLDHTLAVGVGHHHVVQPVRHIAQIEGGADPRGVDHLPARRLDLELARAAQLDQRAGRKARALDVHRHPAVRVVTGAALVGRDTGDGQRQQLGTQRHRRAGGLLA